MDFDKLIQRLAGDIGSLLRTFFMLAILLVILVIGERVQALRDLDTYLQEHDGVRNVLIGVTLAMSVAGALLLALSQFLPGPRLRRSMSDKEAEALSPPIRYAESKVGGGERWGRSFGGEASLANTKEAWRRGAWRHHREWRIFFSMMVGATLTLFGMFGLFIVIGSPGIKFLMSLLLAYALGRTVWALWRA